ncbi:hypothetical protein NEOLI_004294 [Neolecta irregularis DAH-3]|uniref:Uncharacterized protein n=1 Tax=Neolecta irregularis (strain DAH-3) TaxID=1198029 RepID=A0A1U7LUM0_NEOID|nr:hypothetical protein NEOLI_004294 [Neolecta irregularis DAH-3]|eukprot:OLL26211.1 hypothetical protein NEOLI_004294 [Neolecta irregularis DAH-3]
MPLAFLHRRSRQLSIDSAPSPDSSFKLLSARYDGGYSTPQWEPPRLDFSRSVSPQKSDGNLVKSQIDPASPYIPQHRLSRTSPQKSEPDLYRARLSQLSPTKKPLPRSSVRSSTLLKALPPAFAKNRDSGFEEDDLKGIFARPECHPVI